MGRCPSNCTPAMSRGSSKALRSTFSPDRLQLSVRRSPAVPTGRHPVLANRTARNSTLDRAVTRCLQFALAAFASPPLQPFRSSRCQASRLRITPASECPCWLRASSTKRESRAASNNSMNFSAIENVDSGSGWPEPSPNSTR